MFRIRSQSELLECFRISEREEVELPESSRFPILAKDGYFSWVEPSGAKTFLVFDSAGDSRETKLLGVVFRKMPVLNVCMCEWCHCIGAGSEIALLTARATANRRVGVHVCSDLSCAQKIRLNVETGTERQRVRAVVERMTKFARQNLF